MRNPAGVECRYFYGNYFRGQSHEECRLIGSAQPPLNWKPDLCKTCPVPGILRSNACPNMVLEGKVKSILGIYRRVQVKAWCTLSKKEVKEAHIGCGLCHTIPPISEEPGK